MVFCGREAVDDVFLSSQLSINTRWLCMQRGRSGEDRVCT